MLHPRSCKSSLLWLLSVAVIWFGCGEASGPTAPLDTEASLSSPALRDGSDQTDASLGKGKRSGKKNKGKGSNEDPAPPSEPDASEEDGAGGVDADHDDADNDDVDDFWQSIEDELGISWDVDGLKDANPTTKWFQTVEIDAEKGGTNWFGRVKVEIPPGALDEDTEITVCIITEGFQFLDFELLPHGLQFNEPVEVSVNLWNLGLTPQDDVTQYWWDEAAGEYVDIGGDWEYPTLTSWLDHFSRYRAGRAGW